MLLDVHVVVEGDHALAPLGVCVGSRRQGSHCRPIERFADAVSAARQALIGPIVEFREKRTDRGVELIQAKEALVAQACEDPPVHQQSGGTKPWPEPGESWSHVERVRVR